MKKLQKYLPMILMIVFLFVGSRLFFSGAVSPSMITIAFAVFFGVMLLFRPKNSASKPVSDIEQKVRGDFAKDAFADDANLNAKFQAALKDYKGSMPKAAIGKLQKLSPLCRNDQEVYAVSMATALCHVTLNQHKEAAREYNRALVLHQSSELAISLGSSYQRIGELKKAQDSYEFALELEPENTEARSNLATTYVADGDYTAALAQAKQVLELDENHASALATTAICYGLQNDPAMCKLYTDLAVENGYSKSKIEQTVSALKKRK